VCVFYAFKLSFSIAMHYREQEEKDNKREQLFIPYSYVMTREVLGSCSLDLIKNRNKNGILACFQTYFRAASMQSVAHFFTRGEDFYHNST